MGEIDKHVSDGVNKLLIENKCDLTSQELSTDEAQKLADSLNLRLLETSATNEASDTSETSDASNATLRTRPRS